MDISQSTSKDDHLQRVSFQSVDMTYVCSSVLHKLDEAQRSDLLDRELSSNRVVLCDEDWLDYHLIFHSPISYCGTLLSLHIPAESLPLPFGFTGKNTLTAYGRTTQINSLVPYLNQQPEVVVSSIEDRVKIISETGSRPGTADQSMIEEYRKAVYAARELETRFHNIARQLLPYVDQVTIPTTFGLYHRDGFSAFYKALCHMNLAATNKAAKEVTSAIDAELRELVPVLGYVSVNFQGWYYDLEKAGQRGDVVGRMHSHGFVHGDLHSGNTLITFDKKTTQQFAMVIDLDDGIRYRSPLLTELVAADISTLFTEYNALQKLSFLSGHAKYMRKHAVELAEFFGFTPEEVALFYVRDYQREQDGVSDDD